MFALLWNRARSLIHCDISIDIEEFQETGIKTIDKRGKQTRIILIQSSMKEGCMSFSKGK